MKNKANRVAMAWLGLMLIFLLHGCAIVEEKPRSFEEEFALMFGPVQFNEMGVANTQDGQYDRAIQNFDRAIRVNPKYTAAYYNRGAAYMRKGDRDRAIQDFARAITLDPKLDAAFVSRGLVYFIKGEYDHAIADFDHAIQLKPKSAEAFYLRGMARSNNGDSERAIMDFDRAIENFKIVTGANVQRDKAECERIAYDPAQRLPPKEANGTLSLILNSQGFTLADTSSKDPSGVLGLLRPGQTLFAWCMRSRGH
jgi:tetratricopeptide (TPR) repeat protein